MFISLKIVISLLIFITVTLFLSDRPLQAASFGSVKFVKAYDADTITVDIEGCNFKLACDKIGIRVNGVDTPELRTKDKCEKDLGIKARDFVRAELKAARKISLLNLQRGKYFRIVADVIYDGKDLKRELFKRKYAVPYDGGTKHKVDWCKMGI